MWKTAGEGLSDRLVQGTFKFGAGSLMMWGCMSWEGVGYATKIEGKMDADLFVEILEDELQGTLEYYNLKPKEVIFQQDNDPKHTCKKAKEWFKNSGIEVLPWPAQSPGLNSTGNLWQQLKQRLVEYPDPPPEVLGALGEGAERVGVDTRLKMQGFGGEHA